MHDLLRLYARERADVEESTVQRAAAVDRLAGSYLALTRQADRLLRPYVPGSSNQSTTAEGVVAFADPSQARTWLTIERHNLLGCTRVMGPTTEATDLSTVLAVHFLDFGFWSDGQNLYSQALSAYRYLGNRHGEAEALWGLGDVVHLVGEYGQAREYYSQSLALARNLGYQRVEADALGGLGHVEWHVGEYDQAREYYSQALAHVRHLGNRSGEADALWGLGRVACDAGECGHAYELWRKALEIYEELGVPLAETVRAAMCQLDC
jgi:tetratricopeptide (TPR) repeat protein